MPKQLLYGGLRFLLIIAIVVASVITFYYVSTVTYPFIIAFIISFLVNPLVNFFQDRVRLPRILAVLLVLLLLFTLLGGLIALLVFEIITGTQYLAEVIPAHFQSLVTSTENYMTAKIIPYYNDLAKLFNTLDSSQQSTITTNIQSFGSKIVASVGKFMQNILTLIPTILSKLPFFATVSIFSLLATFFISKDWYRFTGFFHRMLPEKARGSSVRVFIDLKRAGLGYLKAQATLISVTAVMVLIGLLILKVEYAITISLIIGISELLPYIGTGITFVPWIIYTFISGDSTLAIGLIIIYIIGIVVRQVIEPKVLSSSIGVDPFATLVALFVGVELFGFLGLIIGPILLVVVGTLYRAGVFTDLWGFIKGGKI